MAIDLSELSPQEAITALYVGYFDRAPDPAGLNYWVGQLNGGMSLAAIAMSFAVQPEATDEYPYLAIPNVANATSFLQAVYLNLFNRTVDADDDGLQYWADELMSNPENLGQIILSIINGAQNEDREVVLNKIEVGVDFADELSAAGIVTFDEDTNPQANQLAQTIFDGVTDDDDSVEDAMALIDAFVNNPDSVGVPGEIFTLTDGIDNIQGTNGDDLIRGPIVDSLETVDVIQGGAGTDTLRATLESEDAAPVMSGVENVFLTNTDDNRDDDVDFFLDFADENNFGIDLDQVTGVQQLWATNADDDDDNNGTDNNATFTAANVASLATIFGVTNNAAGLNYNISLASNVNISGGADTLTLAVDDNDDFAADFRVSGNGDSDDIENINVLALGDTGGTADFIDLSAFDGLETITVAGSGDINFEDEIDELTTFDGSAATGDIYADLSNSGNNDLTVLGGSGNDTFFGDAGDDLIVGGAGDDSLFGGNGDDIFGGGAGADTINLGDSDDGDDEVHFDGPSGGDTILNFDIDDDVISFLDGGVIDFANSEEDDSEIGDSDLDSDDYEEFSSIGQLLLQEGANTNPVVLDQKVINITDDVTINDIGQLETANAAEFYAVFEIQGSFETQIYYDADWSNTEGRELVATIVGAEDLTIDNFDVY